MNAVQLSALAEKIGSHAARPLWITQVRFRKNLWEPRTRYINEGKLTGWKRRDGDRTKPGFRLARMNELVVHPGLNVELKRDLSLHALTHGTVVETVEKTNLDFDNFLVQLHYPHLKGDDSRFYRAHVHVIPDPQPIKFKLKEQS